MVINTMFKVLDDNECNEEGKPNWVYNTCDALNYLGIASSQIEAVIRHLKELNEENPNKDLAGCIDYLEEGYDKLESGYISVCRIPTCGSWPKIPDKDKRGC